jgi:chorismate mutase/prephenate dehydratase
MKSNEKKKTKEEDKDIDELRKKIDEIDRKIIELISERTYVVKEIWDYKHRKNIPIYKPDREKEIDDFLSKVDCGLFPKSALKQVFREIISGSRAVERLLRIAYLGPPGTFTHLATKGIFGSSVEMEPLSTISEVFTYVESGYADYGVVPVENSLEGMVSQTLDLFVDSSLLIVSESYLRISHYLLSIQDDIKAIKRLYSHIQPLAQCRKWIDTHLNNVEIVEASSTAKAAKLATWDKFSAAIASKMASEVYGLNILAEHIEDNPKNYTRFLVLGRDRVEATGDDKTSIMVSIKDKPGALYEFLEPFASLGINLTKIESRPSRKRPWEYVFFIDFKGHISDDRVREALEELERRVLFYKFLGSYPSRRIEEV